MPIMLSQVEQSLECFTSFSCFQNFGFIFFGWPILNVWHIDGRSKFNESFSERWRCSVNLLWQLGLLQYVSPPSLMCWPSLIVWLLWWLVYHQSKSFCGMLSIPREKSEADDNAQSTWLCHQHQKTQQSLKHSSIGKLIAERNGGWATARWKYEISKVHFGIQPHHTSIPIWARFSSAVSCHYLAAKAPDHSVKDS